MSKLFISHSSQDKEKVDLFIDEILIKGIGLNKTNDLFYSSDQDANTPLGENWMNDLKTKLKDCSIFIQIVTYNSLKSDICKAEFTAGWVLEKKIIPILDENIGIQDLNDIQKTLQYGKINSRAVQCKLKDEIMEKFSGTKSLNKSATWDNCLNQFMESYNLLKPIEKSNSTDTEKIGFRLVEIDEILERTTEMLKEAKSFKVIGIGRQYYIEERDNKIIQEYYQVIEDRLKNSTESNPFFCKRMTTFEIKDRFNDHLSKCFNYSPSEKRNNSFELSIIDDFEMRFTFYIVDKKLVVINLYTIHDGIIDCPNALVTTNPELIKIYDDIFDEKWNYEVDKKNIIKDLDNFNLRVPFSKEFIKTYFDLKNNIKKFPVNSIKSGLCRNELKIFNARIKGLIGNNLLIENKMENGKILNVFSHFVQLMQHNNSYKTISFYEFWKNPSSTNLEEFITANEIALQHGGLLSRIYLVNINRLEEIDFIHQNQNILRKHLRLCSKYKSNYSFKLLFQNSSEYDDNLKNYKNFALLELNNDRIIFSPRDTSIMERTYENLSTNVYFFKTNNPEKNDPEVERAWEIKEMAFSNFSELIPSIKKLTADQLEFLNACGIEEEDYLYLFR